MSQCDRRYSATQYALLTSVMGLTNVLFRTPTGFLYPYPLEPPAGEVED